MSFEGQADKTQNFLQRKNTLLSQKNDLPSFTQKLKEIKQLLKQYLSADKFSQVGNHLEELNQIYHSNIAVQKGMKQKGRIHLHIKLNKRKAWLALDVAKELKKLFWKQWKEKRYKTKQKSKVKRGGRAALIKKLSRKSLQNSNLKEQQLKINQTLQDCVRIHQINEYIYRYLFWKYYEPSQKQSINGRF